MLLVPVTGKRGKTIVTESIKTDDIHIKALKTLIPPAVLIDQLPVSEEAALVVK